ncbi:MAG: glucosaminidase domain-containing protein [Bacteroidales bacterium]|nr:glucosaminidase domain-containing protein [Bacteroidales bacterium]
MRRISYLAFFLIVILIFSGCGTKKFVPRKSASTKDYINTYRSLAIEQMHRYKIPASIKLAQAILESGSGNSTLATKANNHFGIKCNNGWRGAFYRHDDDLPNECFRKYNSVEQSYKDHSQFLTSGRRYSRLFDLNVTDYKGWARGLKRAGYATNPQYAQLLIGIIERYDLDRLDRKKPRQIKKEMEAQAREITPNERFLARGIDSSEFRFHEQGPNNRKIYLNNGKKFVFARENDSFLKIAKDFKIYAYQIYKYNDLNKHSTIYKGQMIYLEKKRNKGTKKYHTVGEGESMHFIAQRYGIKLDKLYKKNRMEPGSQPHAGVKLKLR